MISNLFFFCCFLEFLILNLNTIGLTKMELKWKINFKAFGWFKILNYKDMCSQIIYFFLFLSTLDYFLTISSEILNCFCQSDSIATLFE
jgi:hypothetical protein